MDQPVLHSPKLNPLLLPSQTAVLFAIIVLVFLAAALSGAIGPSPFCVAPIALGIFLLPLRAYLAWPDREIARYALRAADESYAPLQAEIAALSVQIGLSAPPRLLISDQAQSIYTFGSFRRRYMGLGTAMAHLLITDLSTPANAPRARALLLHELYHFRSGDTWQMGYSRELLRTVAVFLSWIVAFFTGTIFLIMMTLPAYLRADLSQIPGLDPGLRAQLESWIGLDVTGRAEIAQKASQINFELVAMFVFNSLLPMVVVGLVVWLFYWRKLLRVRELYADAGAAQALGDARPLQQALVDYGLGLTPGTPTQRAVPWPHMAPALDAPLAFGGEAWQGLLRLHPHLKERVESLQTPDGLSGSWKNTALVVGILILLLDVLLVSPFTAYYLSSFPMHFSALTAFIAISVSLLPGVAQGKRLGGDIARIVAVVMALRVSWLTVNLALMVALYALSPAFLSDLFEIIIRNASRSAAFSSVRVAQDVGSLMVNAAMGQAAFQVVIGLALLACLYADVWLKRRVFTWYGCRRTVLVCWGSMGWLAFVLGTVVLIPLTALILSEPGTLFNPVSLLLMSVAAVVTVIGVWIFVRLDRRYSGRCPHCGGNVCGGFELGRRCPQCGEAFHSWLLANY